MVRFRRRARLGLWISWAGKVGDPGREAPEVSGISGLGVLGLVLGQGKILALLALVGGGASLVL